MKPNRIEAIDLLRGHFLVAMIVDHLAFIFSPSVWEFYNGNGKLWVSAAEGFIFLAGLMVGYLFVAVPKYDFGQATRKLLFRSVSLYAVTVTVTIITSLFLWGEKLPLTGIFSLQQTMPEIFELIGASLLLQHRYGWVNILTLYACLFFISPVIVFLLHRKHVLPVVIISIIIWLLSQFGLIRAYMHGIYDLFSWQLLFVLGAVLGTHLVKVRATFLGITSKKFVRLSTVILTLVIALLSVKIGNDMNYFGIQPFTKNVLGVGRLFLFPIWLTGTYTILTIATKVLPKQVKTFYLWFGQHSLQIYILHGVILTVLASSELHTSNYWINTFAITGVLLATLGLSNLLSRFKYRKECDSRI